MSAHVRVRAPAKLNLRLVVLGREEFGYHHIESLFCALALADTVEVEAGESGIRLDVRASGLTGDAPDLGPAERNLAVRAADAYFEAAGRRPAATVRLTKRIPVGAGLGGGSSDAAATLRALDRLHGRRLGPHRLLRIGAQLGSDVPFFLAGARFALAWGRGERIMPLLPLPSAPIVLAVPPFPSPTGQAYTRLAEARSGDRTAAAPPPFRLRPPRDWRDAARAARNDFEPVLFPRFPELRALKRDLREAGAAIAILAGSGSAVAGVFDDRRRRDDAAHTLAQRHPGVGWIRTRTAGPTPRPPRAPADR